MTHEHEWIVVDTSYGQRATCGCGARRSRILNRRDDLLPWWDDWVDETPSSMASWAIGGASSGQ